MPLLLLSARSSTYMLEYAHEEVFHPEEQKDACYITPVTDNSADLPRYQPDNLCAHSPQTLGQFHSWGIVIPRGRPVHSQASMGGCLIVGFVSKQYDVAAIVHVSTLQVL